MTDETGGFIIQDPEKFETDFKDGIKKQVDEKPNFEPGKVLPVPAPSPDPEPEPEDDTYEYIKEKSRILREAGHEWNVVVQNGIATVTCNCGVKVSHETNRLTRMDIQEDFVGWHDFGPVNKIVPVNDAIVPDLNSEEDDG